MLPAVGQEAPDFTLADQHGRAVTLSSYRGRSGVLLMFYPYAFSPVCSAELAAVRDDDPGPGVEVLGVSCDSIFVLRHFAEALGLERPLLSDFWPHGEVARRYGVLDEERGCPTRASLAVDAEGRVRWVLDQPVPEGRAHAEHRRAADLIRR